MAVGRLRPLFSLSHASPICPNSALPRKPCCSSGEVVATGSFQTADVVTSGISTVYLSGVSQAVNLELGGVTDLYLQPASDSVQITGRWAWGRMWLQWEAAVAEHPEPTTHCHGAVSSPNHPVPAHLSASAGGPHPPAQCFGNQHHPLQPGPVQRAERLPALLALPADQRHHPASAHPHMDPGPQRFWLLLLRSGQVQPPPCLCCHLPHCAEQMLRCIPSHLQACLFMFECQSRLASD